MAAHPRYLIMAVAAPTLNCVVATYHAPIAEHFDNGGETWWTEFRGVLKAAAPGDTPVILLGDANAKL